MLRDCDEATRIAEAGMVPSLEQRARYRRDGAYAATLCTRAVDVLFPATGGGAIYARNPMQRAFRDIHAANAHYVLNWDINGAMYGRVALGPAAGRDAVTREVEGATVPNEIPKQGPEAELPAAMQRRSKAPRPRASISRELRNALGTFGTGVTIITTRSTEGGLYRHDRQLVHLGVADPAAGAVERLALRAEPAGLPGKLAFRRQHPGARPDRAVEQVRQVASRTSSPMSTTSSRNAAPRC